VADAPFTNQLARRYSVATSYHGVTHPSLPNYLAAISGDFQGVWNDCKAGPTSTVLTCDPTAPLSELSFVLGAGDATDPGFSLCTNPNSPLYKVVPPQLTAAQIVSAENTPHWFTGKTRRTDRGAWHDVEGLRADSAIDGLRRRILARDQRADLQTVRAESTIRSCIFPIPVTIPAG